MNPSVPSFLCRFPTFTDAVRDLDDCLTLCFTFANFPATKRTQVELVHTCRRLTGMTDWLTLVWAAVFFLERTGLKEQGECVYSDRENKCVFF